MNFAGDQLFWLLIVGLLGIVWITWTLVNKIADVKESKYESFMQYRDLHAELSNFYSWLVYHYVELDATADPDELAKDYLNRDYSADPR